MSQYPAMTNAPVPAAPTLPPPRSRPTSCTSPACCAAPGLPVGPAETIAAQQALTLIDLGSQDAKPAPRCAPR